MPSLPRRSVPEPSAADWAFSRLLAYSRFMWSGFQGAAHLRLIAGHLEAMERGEIDRLIVALPPRHGKSKLITTDFPAWYLGRNPTRQVMVGTYGQRLADKWGRQIRNQLKQPRFQAVFPGVGLAGDSKAAADFATNQEGSFFGTGRGGAGTGLGAHLFVVDDPTKDRKEAESRLVQEDIRAWYTDVLTTRLMPDAAVVVVMTRWVEGDLVGWLLKEHAHENWTVVNLPALAEDDDPLGRAPGEALWPSRYSVAALNRKKATLPPRSWAALYQQRPVPKEGGSVKPAWFERRRFDAPPFRPQRIIQAWDTARKAKEKNDPSVCVTFAETDKGLFLLDVFRARLTYTELRTAAKSLASKWSPDLVLIEDSANGSALFDDLSSSGRLPLALVSCEGMDKESRLDSVTDLMEGGLVWFPEEAEWLTEFERELYLFPASEHDDQVDALAHALRWFKARMKAEDADDETLTLGHSRGAAVADFH